MRSRSILSGQGDSKEFEAKKCCARTSRTPDGETSYGKLAFNLSKFV